MSTVGPVDHIARTALPWRSGSDLTECGKTPEEVGGRVVTRDAIEKRIRDVGKKRAAFETCMTCAETSDRWTRRGGAEEVIAAVAREAQAVENATPPREPRTTRTTVHSPAGTFEDLQTIRPSRGERTLWERRQRLVAELEAIAALIATHREEFEGYLSGLGETVSLAERRTAKRSQQRRPGGA